MKLCFGTVGIAVIVWALYCLRGFTSVLSNALWWLSIVSGCYCVCFLVQACREPQRGPGNSSCRALNEVLSEEGTVPRKFLKIPHSGTSQKVALFPIALVCGVPFLGLLFSQTCSTCLSTLEPFNELLTVAWIWQSKYSDRIPNTSIYSRNSQIYWKKSSQNINDWCKPNLDDQFRYWSYV